MLARKGPVPAAEINQQALELSPFFEDNGVPEADRYMFAFYWMQAPEGSRPEWTWDRFDRGIAPLTLGDGEYNLDKVDELGDGLIPNFRRRSEGLSPLLDAVKPYAEEINEILKNGSLLVVSNHPTIATPFLTARSVIEALSPERPNIQQNTYITFGMLPTVFEYDFGEIGTISPVRLATAVGNVAITAAVSDSNMQPDLKKSQEPIRNWYKGNVADILQTPGNILVVIPNGQRDVQFSKMDPSARKIHHPEGDLDIFCQAGAHVLNMAVYDRLLDAPGLASPVQVHVDPRIRPVSIDMLSELNIFQAETLNPTFDDSKYFAERRWAMDLRLSERTRMLKAFAEERVRDFFGGNS